MRIYVGHASSFDYLNELYLPLKKSLLWQQREFILPHEFSKEPCDSKKIICQCDLMLAEVSYPSTGLGIELGWANSNNIPILGIYKTGCKISSSLHDSSEGH